MAGIVGTNLVAQVGFVVKDIEAAKVKWAEFLGLPVPQTVGGGDFEITQTQYKGQPAPDAQAKLAFLDVGQNFQLELIEPNEAPSTWRESLDAHGEGVHHLAFVVKDTKSAVASCEAFGMKLEQTGQYGSGGGRYTYLSSDDQLKVIIELLENYS